MKTHEKIPVADVVALLSWKGVSPDSDPNKVIRAVLGPKGDFAKPGHLEEAQKRLRESFPDIAKYADDVRKTIDSTPREKVDIIGPQFANHARKTFGNTVAVELPEPRPSSAFLHKLHLLFCPKQAPVVAAPAASPVRPQGPKMKLPGFGGH